MRRTLLCALALSLAAGWAQADTGPVRVEYLNPEKFSDIKDREGPTRVQNNPHLKSLRSYLEKKAVRFLKPGQSLEIRFNDIDLAGHIEPSAALELRDVRIVRGVYPPSMAFDYVVKAADGTPVTSGSVKLKDLGFDTGYSGRATDPLRFEKHMLDKWLRDALGGG